MADMTRDAERMEHAQTGTYNAEHWLAWVFTAGAIAMAVIGLLIGFGMLDAWETDVFQDEGDVIGPRGSFWDGMLWMIGALSLYMLGHALHQSEHHFGQNPSEIDSTNKSLFTVEHALSWVAALAALVLGVIGLLVAYDAFDNDNTVFDGILWMLASLGASIGAATLHTVRHHQMASEEDYIVSVVERYSTSPRSTTGARVPGTTERRS